MSSSSPSIIIDQLTEVPVDLFERLRLAGREARHRGQHLYVKGSLRNSDISLKKKKSLARKSLSSSKMPWHHDNDLSNRAIGEQKLQTHIDDMASRTCARSDATCSIKARPRVASTHARDSTHTTRLNVSAAVGAAFRAIRQSQAFSLAAASTQ